jgi:hypothetical protein
MRRHALFLGFLAFIAVGWFAILLRSQTHVHSDEAIIGLMGKHILEGRYFPFYMYGQAYNAGAAWEAYLAAIAFAIFGVSVISLKSCIVGLSLLGLVLFYWMCCSLYDRDTALVASIVFVLTPSLLKWHYQVRGYSWYFLSIPLLTILFLRAQSTPARKWPRFLFFGIVSGLSIWSLELGIAFTAALWILLLLRRGLSLVNALTALAGFIVGYAPAIAFNLAHSFSNWKAVLEKSAGEGLASVFRADAVSQILLNEMPKFFGPDTVLWYYPQKSAAGLVFYAIAVVVIGVATLPFIHAPRKIASAIRGGFGGNNEERDLLVLILILACSIPYITAPFRVPGYFLAGAFFIAALTGRLISRCFACSSVLVRVGGAIIVAAVLITGTTVMIDVARHDQIETLSLCDQGENYCMRRIPGTDITNVEQHLRRQNVVAVWTSVSFVYPLLFESAETLAASDGIFGYEHRVYPQAIRWREPGANGHFAIVLESDSPLRSSVVSRFVQMTGAPPSISEHGTLAVIEGKPQ